MGEVCGSAPDMPFFIFSELQQNDWSSSARGASASTAAATLLGAARDLRYDVAKQEVLMDGWAPVQVAPQAAMLLGIMKLALRVCLLEVSKTPASVSTNPLMIKYREIVAGLCAPSMSVAETL